jgi:hypothetical protein
MTKSKNPSVVVTRGKGDPDFISQLQSVARKKDRTPAHIARQLIIAGLASHGELDFLLDLDKEEEAFLLSLQVEGHA